MSEKLKAWKVEQAAYLASIGIEQTESTPVFNDELGNFIDEANYGRWWRNFAVDNGFGKFTQDVYTTKSFSKEVTRGKGYEGYTLHELRHTQATLLQGVVSPKAAQHRLGHSQISMTMNTYAHFLDAEDIAVAEAMEAIAVMAHLARSGRVHAMVVCPVALVTNWCREVSRHSSLEALCAHGGRRDAAISRWYAMGGVLVTNYETLCGVGPAAFTGVDVLAVDEAHYVKNPDAMRTRAVADLASRCGYVMLMSGTPMENRVDEMVSIVRMLSPGTADRLALDSRMRDAVAFRDDAAPVYLRRTQEDVLTELPEKEESEQWCALGEEERSSYEDAVRSGSFPRMRRVSWEMPDLRMSAKAMRLSGICEDAEREGRKVIVFSYFLDTVDKAACLLGRRCVGVIRGDVGGRARQDAVDALDAAAPGSAIVCQIGAGGVGLNVQCASVVVICEPQLKPSIESQAIARAHRMGQARTVMVYRLLAEGTVDERIVGMLRSKQDEFDRYADESTMGDASLGRSDERGIVQAEMDRLAA